MIRMTGHPALVFILCLALPPAALAQSYEVLGTRAAGMAGAFVAVADDASAVYWNPGGLATGAYFSLLMDRNSADAKPDGELRAGSGSAGVIALTTPALGLSYYRLRFTTISPPELATDQLQLNRDPTAAGVTLQTLIAHHVGATVVQSLADWITVGATLKIVRGIAASTLVPDDTEVDVLLDEATDLVGAASNTFDADVGMLAVWGRLRAGLTVRNVAEPEFETAGGSERLTLERQARAGVAYGAAEGLVVSADLDLQRVPGPVGDVRALAVGAEAHLLPRIFLRGGFRLNTLDDQTGGRAPVLSIGGSYAVVGSMLVDAQVTGGSASGGRGWGVAARLLF